MNKVRDNLYIGSRHDTSTTALKNTQITAILNLTPDVPQDTNGKTFVRVAMRDTAKEAHEHTDKAVGELNKLLDAGHVVLVHCRQGKSRSPHIIAECLSGRENKDYFDLYKELQGIRPEILPYSIGQEILDNHHKW